ncbi:hypothetical protein UA45_07140 [Morganella morganii]|uniref:Uncharacterized protein n=1 Tax=Morganella morganii TaxID=582 RepID=A0A0D8L980_MORMO|nr:hypothetical protein UA45_07140 [Morganella morganii]
MLMIIFYGDINSHIALINNEFIICTIILMVDNNALLRSQKCLAADNCDLIRCCIFISGRPDITEF